MSLGDILDAILGRRAAFKGFGIINVGGAGVMVVGGGIPGIWEGGSICVVVGLLLTNRNCCCCCSVMKFRSCICLGNEGVNIGGQVSVEFEEGVMEVMGVKGVEGSEVKGDGANWANWANWATGLFFMFFFKE
jgi:hypothetical protein